jgi:hypothetical protein
MAASPGFMMQDCKNSAQILFQDFEARSEAKYEREKGSDPEVSPGNPALGQWVK